MKCFGQPCQKQPSTNTAIFALEKTMSARDRTPFSGEQSTRKRSPRECRIERKASSGLVSRLLFAAIVRRSEERRVGKERRERRRREAVKEKQQIKKIKIE